MCRKRNVKDGSDPKISQPWHGECVGSPESPPTLVCLLKIFVTGWDYNLVYPNPANCDVESFDVVDKNFTLNVQWKSHVYF